MSPFTLLCSTILLLLTPPLTATTTTTTTTTTTNPPTAYNLLEFFDFPPGLLPKGVSSYDLNTQTGQFTVRFNESCSFSVEGSYPLKYKSTVQGYIAKGKLTKLEGVSVKVLLFWVNIIEIVRTHDELEFSVGIASANYPIDNFIESPQCGCGFNCVDKKENEMLGIEGLGRKVTPFVYDS